MASRSMMSNLRWARQMLCAVMCSSAMVTVPTPDLVFTPFRSKHNGCELVNGVRAPKLVSPPGCIYLSACVRRFEIVWVSCEAIKVLGGLLLVELPGPLVFGAHQDEKA